MVMDVGRFSDHVREAMLVGSAPPRLVRPSHVHVIAPMLAVPWREHGQGCWSVRCPCLFFSVPGGLWPYNPIREHGNGCWSLHCPCLFIFPCWSSEGHEGTCSTLKVVLFVLPIFEGTWCYLVLVVPITREHGNLDPLTWTPIFVLAITW